MDPDVEARARAIVDEARRARKPLPRWLWVVAIATSVLGVGGLAYAWIVDRDTVPDRTLQPHEAAHVAGLWVGLAIGIGIGIAIGSALALRRK